MQESVHNVTSPTGMGEIVRTRLATVDLEPRALTRYMGPDIVEGADKKT